MKYVFVYYGQMAENEAERAAGMKAMAAWFGGLGKAVVDGGNPFTAARTVTPTGAVKPGPIGEMPTGYSIVEAASLDAATEMAKTSPLLHSGRQIAVLEVLPMPVRAQSSV